MKKKLVWVVVVIFGLLSCKDEHKLPILGNRSVDEKTIDGKVVYDTVYQKIPAFSFINQDGIRISDSDMNGKIYVADFFFVTCPTICPIMKKQLLRVYEAYKGNDQVRILSHTIDPEHDSIAILKDYCTRLGSDGKQWMFLTGDREKIYELAGNGYYATAMADSLEPGGFVHSGGLILVDKNKYVRGIYNGTVEAEVDHLISDMEILLKEQ